ncbi:DUF4019 domain-containing protein [Caenimonas koreensis DSM 17982]|uniref:DUF4019 domain-containing protein n=1 Tax=Caenimonas koreensis DSM 17982 TaxID=1121255 RepID=A0A844AWC6_9BURK|nr:DUF4019 domain-containing protein [Caenimonas koreensis]MRD46678.1 DUF4019 domain-containing protein [Caenimonas koreensis DSM 17982]
MKLPRSLLVCLALVAAFSATTASAQLKPKSGTGLSAPATPSAPAPATSPAARPGATAPSAQIPGNAAKEEEGKLAAAGWLVLLDRRDWGTAWETTASMFRAAVPLSAWMDGIPKMREPLGKLIERTPTESVYKTTLQGKPDGEYVSVVFQSKFEGKEAEEVVTTVRDTDGRWRVTGYVPPQ